MNKLKTGYQDMDQIRYETQSQEKDLHKKIIEKKKLLKKLQTEDKEKILEELSEKLKDLQHEQERKMSYQKDRLKRLQQDQKELIQ